MKIERVFFIIFLFLSLLSCGGRGGENHNPNPKEKLCQELNKIIKCYKDISYVSEDFEAQLALREQISQCDSVKIDFMGKSLENPESFWLDPGKEKLYKIVTHMLPVTDCRSRMGSLFEEDVQELSRLVRGGGSNPKFAVITKEHLNNYAQCISEPLNSIKSILKCNDF